MSVATSTALIAGAVVAATAAVGSAEVAKSGAEGAAKTQEQGEQTALGFQEQEWEQQQQNEAPYLQAGDQGLSELEGQLSTPGEGLLAQYPGGQFTAPTAAQAEAMPGYQFQLGQGTEALTENAAATGNLMSGTTGTALENYGQGLAQTDYNNLYQQALNSYLTNYGVWNTGQTNTYNRLSGLAGIGQNAAANLGSQGAAASSTIGNTAVGEATAAASGQVGAANAISGGINSLSGLASTIPLYSLLQGQQQQQLNASSYGPMPTGVNNPTDYNPVNGVYQP
jgi:hypothetical protein